MVLTEGIVLVVVLNVESGDRGDDSTSGIRF